MCLDRSRFRARGFHEARAGVISAARRVADDQPFFGCAGLLRMYASSRASSSLFARFATSRAHRWPTYNHLSILNHPLPSTPICSGRLPTTPSMHLQSLTPQTRLSTHFTLASSSLPRCLDVVHGELTPALRPPQATTRRDFGAASSLMSQNDRRNALLLTCHTISC